MTRRRALIRGAAAGQEIRRWFTARLNQPAVQGLSPGRAAFPDRWPPIAAKGCMNEEGFAGHILWLAESDYGEPAATDTQLSQSI